jgi:hypothetical protein
MICGNCTDSHATASAVRECYGLGQTIPSIRVNAEALDHLRNQRPNSIVAGARALGRTIRQDRPTSQPLRETCERCAGTGQFITGTLNGKPTGPGGPCFRCGGKGYQTDADRRRNYGYDNYAPIRY